MRALKCLLWPHCWIYTDHVTVYKDENGKVIREVIRPIRVCNTCGTVEFLS